MIYKKSKINYSQYKKLIVNEIWALIPARSGSKSIKNKNIANLNGKPLIAYSIIHAKKIKYIKRIIFSSDSKKYVEIAKNYGCKDFHYRTKETSSDQASEHSVFFDFIKKRLINGKNIPKYFLHLRPTTPIRKISTINKALKKFLKLNKNYTCLRTMTEMSNPSYRTFRIHKNKLMSIIKKDYDIDKYAIPRQNFHKTYFCNTIADIYLTETILKGKLFGNKVFPMVVNDEYCDIDSPKDLRLASILIKKNVNS
jgi:CMP-N,N'-diacetyllegionaminic acid synthase